MPQLSDLLDHIKDHPTIYLIFGGALMLYFYNSIKCRLFGHRFEENGETCCRCLSCGKIHPDPLSIEKHTWRWGSCIDCKCKALEWKQAAGKTLFHNCDSFGLSHKVEGCQCVNCHKEIHDYSRPYPKVVEYCTYCPRCGGHKKPHSWGRRGCQSCNGKGSHNVMIYMAPRDPEGHGCEFDRYEDQVCPVCEGSRYDPNSSEDDLCCIMCELPKPK